MTAPVIAQSIQQLQQVFPRAGQLRWIGLRSERRAAVSSVSQVRVETGRGLVGDHAAQRSGSLRQVSLFQFEHWPIVSALMAHTALSPTLMRRNLMVSGINLLALAQARFTIGSVLFEGTGLCEPCARMEAALGAGGYNAMVGHGGIVARVVVGGEIALGDVVAYALPTPQLI
jgi:MOSC domain-containing protein YiiM